MIFLGNLIMGVAVVIKGLLTVYWWVVIIATLLTWVRPDPYNPIVRTLVKLTEPAFYWVRRWMPFTMFNGIDLSPIVVLIAVQLVQFVLVDTLMQWGALIRASGV